MFNKIKAKDITTNEWVEGTIMYKMDKPQCLINSETLSYPFEYCGTCFYTGDIVKLYSYITQKDKKTGVFIFSSKYGAFMVQTTDGQLLDFSSLDTYYIKKVGNIYDDLDKVQLFPKKEFHTNYNQFFCPYCGSQIDEDDEYCFDCGCHFINKQLNIIRTPIDHRKYAQLYYNDKYIGNIYEDGDDTIDFIPTALDEELTILKSTVKALNGNFNLIREIYQNSSWGIGDDTNE